jgi:protein-S-isoprenylcysteine O-methyltransferase Ste14
MIGSCVLVPHGANLASTAVALVLHHRIVLGEERFLAERFGQTWHEYQSRVRRYL